MIQQACTCMHLIDSIVQMIQQASTCMHLIDLDSSNDSTS